MDNRVVVITGASGGIGAALGRRVAALGGRPVLAARRERELREVAAACGRGTPVVVADVTRRDQVQRVLDQALAAFGQVDVWVNNAGRGITRPVLDLSDDDVDEMLAVNTKSALYGMQAIVPHFKAQGTGHVINVSSFLSRVPHATFRAAYTASKAALNILTANLRMDLRKTYPGIHVSLVIPGLVITDFQKNAIGGTPAFTPPSGPLRPQSPEEVAEAILSLIGHPVAELYTNPALHDVARRYYDDVGAFESAMMAGATASSSGRAPDDRPES